MPAEEINLTGKSVKDMYGSFMGKVIGTITAIDGSIDTVGIDCGSGELKQVPFEQLVTKEDVVIYIPNWRLESHRLLRSKELALRRLRALMSLSSENDEMKEDAEIIHEKYKSQLTTLNEKEQEIKATLEQRLCEIDSQLKTVKMFLFDAKVQFNSDEIDESKYDSVRSQTSEITERINHEKAEIMSIQTKISDLSLDIDTETQEKQIEESAKSYLDSETGEQETERAEEVEMILPPAPESEPAEPESQAAVHCVPVIANNAGGAMPLESTPKEEDNDWLSRMEAQ